ncbi:response regulator transcription factor [Dethiosulfovibrio sp. F2B]|uniref:response regulator transcription factor n=1 Tax=Dethiosulfovibrio faecalis TaxID=2720018 RepID=UPI001F3F44BC|nr:response regulator transcription factor [Dethiosulfovibrio faecalis]MCF4152131.1 response regulator transcription factor [Dethiosulfovibrio faecalis]
MRILMIGDKDNVSVGESQNLFSDLSREFTVVRISDPEEGLEMLKSNKYDCVIIDRKDAKDNCGMDLVDFNKESGMGLPILIISADKTVDDLVAMFERGADDYVASPCDGREIIARVHSLIRRSAQCHRPLLTCGRLILDPVARECKVDGTSVPLRRREFDILEILMRHDNQVFSRERIISEVWQKEYDGTSNVVDVHIKYLRDKLREHKMDSIVVTVRGVGYKVQCSECN